ncbi:MAG TPA: gephyrin-like molybdotransferase Glp [Candidatus Limnocylindrales bacterium]|nr:gephyrin-like molybdotransferase Glp [Candidatus Limnocylindrales bacterium]
MKPFLRLRTTEEAWDELASSRPLGTEVVPARSALGRVLAKPVTAREDVPHFFRSNMDGFAVRAADTTGASDESSIALVLAGEVAMGEHATATLAGGQAIRVSTGAMMPAGADAVVIVEHTEERGGRIFVRRAVAPGASTIAIAEDLHAGEVVLEAGHRLRGSDVGVVTGVGRAEITVYRTPRVGIAATGDEIVEPEEALPPGRVRNVNQYLLGSMAKSLGAYVVDYGVIRDDERALDELLRRAGSECDVLLLSGGSSKGSKDFVMGSILRVPGADVKFHGIAIAPGKPTMFAEAGALSILGVPGNPAAAAVVFALFASVLIRVREGESLRRILATRPRVRARLERDVTSTPGREDYVRVRLGDDSAGTEAFANGSLMVATPLRGKSVAISTIARADGLLRIPRSSEGLAAGTEVEVLLFQ